VPGLQHAASTRRGRHPLGRHCCRPAARAFDRHPLCPEATPRPDAEPRALGNRTRASDRRPSPKRVAIYLSRETTRFCVTSDLKIARRANPSCYTPSPPRARPGSVPVARDHRAADRTDLCGAARRRCFDHPLVLLPSSGSLHAKPHDLDREVAAPGPVCVASGPATDARPAHVSRRSRGTVWTCRPRSASRLRSVACPRQSFP